MMKHQKLTKHMKYSCRYTPSQLRFHAAHKDRMRRMRAAAYCPPTAPVKALPPPVTVVCNGPAESAASQEMERVPVAESVFCKNCTCERCVQMRLHADVVVERKTVSQILLEVSEKYRVSVNGIKSAQRTKRLVQPRFEVCWCAREETLHSLPAIGRMLGNRDHTSILHAVRKYESWQLIAAGLLAASRDDRLINFDLIIPLKKAVLTDGGVR